MNMWCIIVAADFLVINYAKSQDKGIYPRHVILGLKWVRKDCQDKIRHRRRVRSQKLFGVGQGLLYTSNSAVDRWNQDASEDIDTSEQDWLELSASISSLGLEIVIQASVSWMLKKAHQTISASL